MYRLIKDVDRIVDGDLSADFRIRGGDQLQNLSKGLREMCVSLRENRDAVKHQCVLLKECMCVKSGSLSSAEKEEAIKILEELETKISRFRG